jgi:hypothetical protein
MSVSCKCCVLSGRGLCDELVLRPEESYRVWVVSSVIVKPRTMRRPRPSRGCRANKKNPQSVSTIAHPNATALALRYLVRAAILRSALKVTLCTCFEV